MSNLTPADRELLKKICPELSEELDDRTLHTYQETGWDIECNVSFKTLLSIARRFLNMGKELEGVEDELAICKKALSKQSRAIVDKVLKVETPCQNPTNRMPKTVKLVEFINNLKAEIEEKNEYIRTNLPDRPFKIILAENARYKAALEEEGISIEPLADYAHSAWAGWMKHLFKLSSKNLNGSVIIPKELVARWTLQIETPYVDLPEGMKPSDRKEANKMLSIITEALKGGTPC